MELIGRTIGNYVIKQKIGQGGMGAVFLAEHNRIGRQVAVKVLLPELSKQPQVVGRFFTEAKSSSEIHNEHIIDILDFGELPDGLSYIVMEWLDGRSLRDVLKEGRMVPGRAEHIARGIGRALAAAHARGIVHRDLKPDNIFLLHRGDDPDFVKVLDFGIAKLMQHESAHDIKTQTGALIGTPAYMSPEQCKGQPVDQRTDIYALGVIMFNMLTGQQPFKAEGLGELLLAHMTTVPPPVRQFDPSIPEYLEQAVARALEKDQDKRFQHVEELLASIGDTLSGPHLIGTQPGARRPTGPGAPTINRTDTIGAASGQAMPTTVSKARRSKALVGGALVAVAAGAALIVVMRHPWSSGETQPTASVAQPTAPVAQPTAPVAQPTTPVAQPTAPVEPAHPVAPAAARVTIHTTPASAEISIDDARVSNPFDGKFPLGDLKHRVVVKAPGYRSEAEWITFEGDRELDIALTKGSGTHERAPAHAAAHPTTHPATPPTVPATHPTTTTSGGDKPIYKGTKGKLITEFPE